MSRHAVRPTRARRIWRRVLIGFGAFALVLGVAAGGVFMKLNANISSTELAPSLVDEGTPKGATNILFIGSDSRDLETSGFGEDTGSARSDALMLVHFSNGNTRIDAVQIPRDTLTYLPSCEDTGSGEFAGGPDLMINSALAGGPACSVRAVEQLSNVHIDHFIQLDFDGFASMVDALGGIDVCLDQALFDRDANLDLPAGEQRIPGEDALALARTRHAVGDGSDIGRLGHQQVVMSSIISRARSAGVLTRPDRLLKFLNALTSSITVDEGISSIAKLTGLAKRAKSVPDSKITFITMPNGAAPSDPNRVVKTPDADTIFAAIAADKPVPVASDESADSSDAPVTVVNAAQTSGLAAQAQSALLSAGYTVAAISTGTEPAEVTRLLVDGTPEALSTATAMNKKFGFNAEIVESAEGVTGVWLVLGADRATSTFEPVEPDAVKATTRTAAGSLCA